MMSHSGLCTRSESAWGSRSLFMSTDSASLISSAVRWRMNTGLPRHLIITWSEQSRVSGVWFCHGVGKGDIRTFLPSGIVDRSISTLAWASTSAEADMLTKKSIVEPLNQRLCRWHNLVQHEIATRLHSDAPCTVAFAPAAANKPIDPTTKYWKTRFDTSGRLLM
jgi:hypothetical protein